MAGRGPAHVVEVTQWHAVGERRQGESEPDGGERSAQSLGSLLFCLRAPIALALCSRRTDTDSPLKGRGSSTRAVAEVGVTMAAFRSVVRLARLGAAGKTLPLHGRVASSSVRLVHGDADEPPKLFSASPPADAEAISHIAFGFMASKALFAALDVRLFAKLSGGRSLTSDELAAEVGQAVLRQLERPARTCLSSSSPCSASIIPCVPVGDSLQCADALGLV